MFSCQATKTLVTNNIVKEQEMKKKLLTSLVTGLIVFGVTGMANASLTNIGTATYNGIDYNLIWDDDNNGNSLVWLDYSNTAISWENQMAWAAGIDSKDKVYRDARAALYQHLKDALESKSTDDMIDLTAVCPAETDKERNVIKGALELILETQNKDGGWPPLGSKKSDSELSSILGFVLKECEKYK